MRFCRLLLLLLLSTLLLSSTPITTFAEEKREPQLFFLSPSINWYFPTSNKTKDAFGSSWSGFGVALNWETLTNRRFNPQIGNLTLHPFFGYYRGERANNDATVIPIGLEGRWHLYSNETVRLYSGVGLAVNAIKFEDQDAGKDISWRGAVGGRVMIGADITKWFNIQAAYNVIDSVEGYNFDGFSARATLRLYF